MAVTKRHLPMYIPLQPWHRFPVFSACCSALTFISIDIFLHQSIKIETNVERFPFEWLKNILSIKKKRFVVLLSKWQLHQKVKICLKFCFLSTVWVRTSGLSEGSIYMNRWQRIKCNVASTESVYFRAPHGFSCSLMIFILNTKPRVMCLWT